MSHVTESSPAHPGRAEESAPLRPTSPLGIAAAPRPDDEALVATLAPLFGARA